MALFLVNDSMVKLVSERLAMDQIVLLRGIFGSLLVLAFLVVAQPWTLRFLVHPGMVRVGGRAALDAAASFTYLWALFHLPLPNVSAINLSSPLFVTMLAVLLLGEVVAWRRWSAIAAGLVGVLMVVQPSSDAFTWFSLVALAGTLMGAVRDVLTRRIALEIPSVVVTFTSTIAITTIAGLSVLVRGWSSVTTADLALLAGASLFLVGAYHLIIVAMRVAESSVVAPFRYTAILWALLLGYAIWGDVPNGLALAGIAVVVGSGLYLMHRERLATRRQRVLGGDAA